MLSSSIRTWRENMTTDKDQQIGYASVNGLDIYYEIRGSGEPLVLLPGGFMTVEAMGDDIAALIRHLGLDQADIFGFSLGGGVGLQTAIRHPEVARKLALASTAFKRDGWYPEVLAGMASISVETFAGTPIHETYLKTSPRPEAWPTFVAKMRHLLSEDYDWAEDVAALTTPTLILVADEDGLRSEHAVEFFGLLGGGKADGDIRGLPPAQLAVLPVFILVRRRPPYHGIMTRTELLLPIITEFLDSAWPVVR